MVSFRIGVDGGGTTTRAVVVDGESNVVMARTQSGSSNLYNLGLEGALQNIHIAVDAALEQAGMVVGQIDSWGFGLAGVTGEHEKSRWQKALGARYGAGAVIDEDVVAALVGAFGPDELKRSGGAVLIAGTGANCFGQNESGQRARADGWGPMLGDRGSGFWLGESGIRAAVASWDGATVPTPLAQSLLKHFDVPDLNALVGVIYDPTFPRDRIAAFVPFVLQAARDGDAVSMQLMHDAGTHLASTARAVLEPLGLKQLALAGGLIENAPEIRESLARSLPGIELLQPRYEPVVGAALMPLAL
ncbi:N-acetylmuramic acid/N-acetylglucosamine kinase [Abditibacteriota bacterium]|nr:N-acetylmuramic acid/N-acetylglucosamine kinase [Abditibacteriota bacterium]